MQHMSFTEAYSTMHPLSNPGKGHLKVLSQFVMHLARSGRISSLSLL